MSALSETELATRRSNELRDLRASALHAYTRALEHADLLERLPLVFHRLPFRSVYDLGKYISLRLRASTTADAMAFLTELELLPLNKMQFDSVTCLIPKEQAATYMDGFPVDDPLIIKDNGPIASEIVLAVSIQAGKQESGLEAWTAVKDVGTICVHVDVLDYPVLLDAKDPYGKAVIMSVLAKELWPVFENGLDPAKGSSCSFIGYKALEKAGQA